MAKKSLKHQSKSANAATTDPAIIEEPAPTEITAPATKQLPFFDFITLATTEDIKKFLKLMNTTLEGKNLENLWRRAYGEGYEKGRKVALLDLETEMKDRFREGIAKGMDLGREQGYNVAKEAFDEIIKVTKAREVQKVDTSEAGTQTDPPLTPTSSVSTQTTLATISQARNFIENWVDTRLAPTVAVSMQTNTIIVTAPFSTSTATQTDPSNTISRTTTDLFVQTDSIIITPSSASPTLLPATSTASTTTADTKTDTTTSLPRKIELTTHIATSQSPESSSVAEVQFSPVLPPFFEDREPN